MEVIDQTPNGLQEAGAVERAAPTYWLTRFVILRLLGAIYAIAFLVAINQVVPLIGEHGLTPVGIYLERVSKAFRRGGVFIEEPCVLA